MSNRDNADFYTPEEEYMIIGKIVDRMIKLKKAEETDRKKYLMFISAGFNKFKIDLDKLYAFKDFDFVHDVLGIVDFFNDKPGSEFFQPQSC